MSKDNPHGVLERGWARCRVGDVAELRNQLRTPLSREERAHLAGPFPYYGPTGRLDLLNRFKVAGPHVLVGEDGDHFLKFRERPMAQLVRGRFSVNNHAHLLRGTSRCLTEWLYYFFLHADLSAYLTRQGVARYKLTKAALLEIPVWLPPVDEQQKMVDLLRTWDEAVGKLDILLKCKVARRRAFRHTLLAGSRRLSGFREAWETQRLGDLTEQVRQRNHGLLGADRLYAVTKAQGLVPMREQVRGDTSDRCQVVKQDWFAYNPMRINIGSLARWSGREEIMVSAEYVVFRCFSGRLSPAFFDQLRYTSRWVHFVAQQGSGSVRVRLYFDDIARFRFCCPPVQEQVEIARALDDAGTEIAQISKQRDATIQQKRGLLQQLLSGKMRVVA